MEGEWQLVLYATESGRSPVAEYLDSLPTEEAARLREGIDLLKRFGLRLGTPHVRCMGSSLWELRIRGRLHHRVLYFAATGRELVLLHAFAKKTPKTPRAELQTARRRMADYQERTRC